MTTPVDEESFGALVTRFGTYLDTLDATLKTIFVQTITSAGPVNPDLSVNGGSRMRIANGGSATPIVINLAATAPAGTVLLLRQSGVSPLKLVPASGAALLHRLGHNGTAGQYAGIAATVEANDGGSAAQWVLDGDTAVVT